MKSTRKSALGKLTLTVVLAAAASALATHAGAIDFSCREASSAAERTICSDARLGRLDDQMATVYGQLWSATDHRSRMHLRNAQYRFLGARDACGRDASCIRGAYLDQIGVLDGKLLDVLGH